MARRGQVIDVLYVDDDVGTEPFTSLVELLQAQAFRITSAPDASSALRILNENPKKFAAIVLDIIMPPLDSYSLEETDGGLSTGWRLLEDIRREWRDIPVIVVTVSQLKDLEGVRRRLRVSKVLPKDTKSTVVAAAIRAAIEEQYKENVR